MGKIIPNVGDGASTGVEQALSDQLFSQGDGYYAGGIPKSPPTDAPHPQYPSTPKFNEHVFHANKDRSLEEVQADFEHSYNESLALVQQLTEAELAMGEVWKLVGYNTYNHYKWARTMIRRWQRAQSKPTSGRAGGA
jgi:hypothetical protein